VKDKVFLFGGTSPFSNTNTHDYDIDENLQGVDAKLMDHSDLHVLDFGMFLVFILLSIFVVPCVCDFNPFAPLNFELPLYPPFPYNYNHNILALGNFRCT
jgi:hypothetical protein